ncbi:phosphoribosyltransferase [Mesorhizobium sp. KR1-2]|uniref:phosphoribosyltransferase n=1 Tax=Mesorhizobium sp. KR1-2 TaxID=3156609 RepID=UPI0032B42095
MFRDRQQAGAELGAELAKLGDLHDPVVLALPRGGVAVAAEIARVLHAPLDLLIVRKIGAPGNPELAMAAVVDGDPPDVVVNREIAEFFRLTDEQLAELVQVERPELERRRAIYLAGRKPIDLTDRSAIVVDDGVATGTTMAAALKALRRRGAREVVLAIPVAPAEVVAQLRQEADRTVCLSQPEHFRALGYHYLRFPQLSDKQVIDALEKAG